MTEIASFNTELLNRLVADELISEEQGSMVRQSIDELEINVVSALSRLSIIGEDTLYRYIAEQLNWSLIEKINQLSPAIDIIESCQQSGLNIDWCIAHHMFPLHASDDNIKIFTDKPLDRNASQPIHLIYHSTDIEWCLLTPAMAVSLADEIAGERAVSELFGQNQTNIATLAEEAPVINLVNSVIDRAILAEASDIHIEAGAKNLVIRFRVDGKLIEFMQQPASRFQAIASRIKLLSEMDIAERRLPQDGRFTTRSGSKEFDVRVSTAPDVNGESIVMRLLPKKRDDLSIDALGFESDHLALIKQWGALSNGIVLVTGPTGSGKSTTLYALLADIKSGTEKIVTVEDPVEYQLPGITQVQAKPEIGYTFAKALRTFLRQDPDVIMVGEIRDKETADIATQSSLTGHLVLSTLHTNDACSVFPRLADIGVETYLTAATVQGVQAQRLVRKLCPHCSQPASKPDFLSEYGNLSALLEKSEQTNWRKAVGCDHCHGRGYRGRIGIYELIPVNEQMRKLVADNAPVADIRNMARAAGHRSLLEDGLFKAAKGLTTVDEVLRVCSTSGDE